MTNIKWKKKKKKNVFGMVSEYDHFHVCSYVPLKYTDTVQAYPVFMKVHKF